MAVVLIHFPADRARLDELRSGGLPRLIIVDEGAEPPEVINADEDWVRVPIDSRDLMVRIENLELVNGSGRGRPPVEPPRIDETNVLHYDGRWVALSEIDAALMRPLLDHAGAAVSREALIAATWPENDVNRNVLDVHMVRLRRRIETLGLTIHTLRGRGYLVDLEARLSPRQHAV